MSRFSFVLLLLFIVLLGLGCSNNPRNPIESSAMKKDFPLPVMDSHEGMSNHSLSGIWSVHFDIDNLTAELTSSRETETHFNVTSFLPTPSLHVNSFNPTTNIIDVDVTISNPFTVNAYDVRLIIFTDNQGHKLINADNWTSLYDKPGGLSINPFKSYATGVTNRKFTRQTQQTENLQIYLSGGNPNISFAIDASYPGNCAEPYLVTKFVQINIIYNVVGSVGRIEGEIHDWQDDVNAAYFYCPAITGVMLQQMFPYMGDIWGMNLKNATGAPAGEYPAIMLATSTGSGSLALYNWVTITITPNL